MNGTARMAAIPENRQTQDFAWARFHKDARRVPGVLMMTRECRAGDVPTGPGQGHNVPTHSSGPFRAQPRDAAFSIHRVARYHLAHLRTIHRWHATTSFSTVRCPDVPPRPQPLSGTPPKPLGPGWSMRCIRDRAPCITTAPVSSRNEILQLRRDYTWVHDHFLQMMMKRRVLSSEYNQGISSEHSVTADFRHHLPAQPQH